MSLTNKMRETFSHPQINLVRVSQVNLKVKWLSLKNKKNNTLRTIESGTKSMSKISKSQTLNYKRKLKS